MKLAHALTPSYPEHALTPHYPAAEYLAEIAEAAEYPTEIIMREGEV